MSKITKQQLQSYLWESANILRGKIDSGDFKHSNSRFVIDSLEDNKPLLISELVKGMQSKSQAFKNGGQMVDRITFIKSKNR